MDEIKKKSYINLKNQLISIRSNLYDLDNQYKKVNNSLKNNIIIDKETIGEEELNIMESNINSTIYQINNVVMPIVNRNINS